MSVKAKLNSGEIVKINAAHKDKNFYDNILDLSGKPIFKFIGMGVYHSVGNIKQEGKEEYAFFIRSKNNDKFGDN